MGNAMERKKKRSKFSHHLILQNLPKELIKKRRIRVLCIKSLAKMHEILMI
jgi:hypothetical protein